MTGMVCILPPMRKGLQEGAGWKARAEKTKPVRLN